MELLKKMGTDAAAGGGAARDGASRRGTGAGADALGVGFVGSNRSKRPSKHNLSSRESATSGNVTTSAQNRGKNAANKAASQDPSVKMAVSTNV